MAKTIADKIGELKDARAHAIDSMQSIQDLSEAENRTYTDDERVKWDEFDATDKSLTDQIERLERLDTVQKRELAQRAARATPATDGGAYELPGTRGASANPRIQVVRNLPKGIAFTRYALALMCSKGMLADAEVYARRSAWADTPEVVRAVQTARQMGGPQVLRAAVPAGTTQDPTFAAPLVEYQTMAGEFIELLRPASIMGALQAAGANFRAVPFGVRIAKQTASSVAQWVGEGMSKPVSKPGFGAMTVPFSKIAVIVVITEELARFSNPSAETLIRDDMVKAISDFMNQQFIDVNVAGTPNLSPESPTHAGVKTPSTGNTVAQVSADIGGMLTRIASANLSLAGLAWVMNPRTRIYLSMLRTAQDVYAFPELAQNRFRGYPVVESNMVPIAGNGQTTITLMDTREILLADDGNVVLDTSTEASLQLDSAPGTPPVNMVSLWQQNMLGIRAERFIYWELLNANAVQVLTAVAY